MPPKPTVTRSIRIDAELLAALESLAAKDKRSVNNLIEVVLTDFVDMKEGWPE